MARTKENTEDYTPPSQMSVENKDYMRDNGLSQVNQLGESYNEKIVDLHFNLDNLPANIKYTKEAEIIPNIKKGVNITDLLALKVDFTENKEFDINNFLIKDTITSFTSSIPLEYDTLKIEQVGGSISITTPNILDLSKDEALTHLNLTELSTGDYILHGVVNKITDDSVVSINDNEHTYKDIGEVEVYYVLKNVNEININCTDCYITEVSLIPYINENDNVYHVSNENYNPELKIIDYDKETVELNKYEGFIKPSYTQEV